MNLNEIKDRVREHLPDNYEQYLPDAVKGVAYAAAAAAVYGALRFHYSGDSIPTFGGPGQVYSPPLGYTLSIALAKFIPFYRWGMQALARPLVMFLALLPWGIAAGIGLRIFRDYRERG